MLYSEDDSDRHTAAGGGESQPGAEGDPLFCTDHSYRLKVFPIATARLRDHAEDIPIPSRPFKQKYGAGIGKRVDGISPETMRALVNRHGRAMCGSSRTGSDGR